MAAKFVYSILIFIICVINVSLQSLQDDITLRLKQTETSLSRKRRYLVFPEGSSLQLVFCFTMPSLGVGDIFSVGSTIALAWELPHDPFVPFRKPSDLLHRIDKPKKPTSGGWTLKNTKSWTPVTYMKTYYNPFIINKTPASSYATIQGYSKSSETNPSLRTFQKKKHLNYIQYHSRSQTNRFAGQQTEVKDYSEPVTSYLHPVYHKVYRRTRRDLYNKIEKLFTGMGKDGKACLMKTICEVSKATREKGTFIEEIIKVIFRVRHHEDEGREETDDYDIAANKQHNCTEMYPRCKHSIWKDMFSFS